MAAPPVQIAEMARQNIRAQRARLGRTQASVSKRMNQLGFSWYPQTVGLVERNQRPLYADELVALALCLDTTPDVLYGPPGDVSSVMFGDKQVPAQRLWIIDDSIRWDGDTLMISAPSVTYRPAEQRAMVHELRDQLGRQAGDDHDQAQEPIVAAIVTSPLGVLVGRRMDGKPPWTFIAGEREPGEAPADTAIREVKEEAGLRIRAGEVIGERVHPKSGRHMVYLAAAPTHGTDVFVGDEEELAEVRWVSLAEADQLMGGTIYEPVHEYLARELRRQPGGGTGGDEERGDDRD
jgi:8-oxo-dGTP pyrophosphatase MutT (NUDIX family)